MTVAVQSKRICAGLASMLLVVQLAGSQTVSEIRNPFGGTNARITAMGDAGAADSHDIGSLYWNPAALSFLTQSSLLVDYTRAAAGQVSTQIVAIPFRVGQTQTFGVGLMFNRNDAGPGTNAVVPLPREYGLDLAGSMLVQYGFSVGMRLGFRYADDYPSRVYLGFGSIGLDYTPDPGISYALVYNGLSLGSRILEDDQAKTTVLSQLPRNFEIALTMHFPSTRQEHVLNMSLANQKIIGISGLLYKGGVEVFPWPFVGLRIGYITGPVGSGPHYGVGFKVDRVQLGYAYVPTPLIGPQHQLSLLIAP